MSEEKPTAPRLTSYLLAGALATGVGGGGGAVYAKLGDVEVAIARVEVRLQFAEKLALDVRDLEARVRRLESDRGRR